VAKKTRDTVFFFIEGRRLNFLKLSPCRRG